jgi:serine protease
VPVRRATTIVAAGLLVAGLIAPGTTIAGSSAAPSRAGQPSAAAVPDSVARTGQVLVQWAGVRSAQASSAPARVGAIGSAARAPARFVRVTASGAAVYDLDTPLGQNAPRILDRIRRVPGVTSVEPDLWMTHTGLPNDAHTNALWGLIDGSLSSAPNYGIDAPGVWRTTTGTGIRVAVIDTGILFSHPDLVGQTVPGYDMISNPAVANDGGGRDSNAADPGDWITLAESSANCPVTNSSWHGTHVAGTIAAKANNSIGVFGGAPGVKIQPVRVLGKCGGQLSDVADGIVWASGGPVPGLPVNNPRARVLSLSLGGFSTCPAAMSSAIAGARSRGSVVVVAAGNANSNAASFTPANCAGVVTVAAIDQRGKRAAAFSNFGAVVDVAGPGVAIRSTLNSGAQGPNTSPAGWIYVDYQGTSMATPHVSLTAALLLAADASLTPDEVEALLKDSARPFPRDTATNNCFAPPTLCGAGIVYARGAIEELLATHP